METAVFRRQTSLILKGGMIAAATMGDPSASIPIPQPVHYRPTFGAFGGARLATSMIFVSQAAGVNGGVVKRMIGVVRGCRKLSKRDMINNSHLPRIEVDPQTYEVRVDGELLTGEPASVLPLAQRYFLF